MKRLKRTALWDWVPHEAVISNAKRFETTVLWDWAPHEAVTRNAKRDETYVLQDWAPCEAPSSVLGRADEKSSMPPPPPARGVGGYNHHCIGEEVEWRPLLLYANPLGHRVPAASDM